MVKEYIELKDPANNTFIAISIISSMILAIILSWKIRIIIKIKS